MRILAGFTTLALFLNLTLPPVLAQEGNEVQKEKIVAEVNSFELFWPLVAGRTMDDGFIYSLKILKETVRGWLVFGNSQKADYAVFLGTKRVLEAEKLLKEEEKDVADKTFDEALEQFKEAQENVVEASAKKSLSTNSVATMKPRLNNLMDFLPTLMSDKAKEVLQKVSDLNTKI